MQSLLPIPLVQAHPPKPRRPTYSAARPSTLPTNSAPRNAISRRSKVLLSALAGVLVIAGIFAFFQRAKPQGAGSLDNVTAVQIPGQTTSLVALTFTLHNSGQKPLWVHDIQGKLITTSGEQTSDAVSAVDFDRYYQAFPALKANAQPPLSPEDKLQPGQEIKRTVIVGFPVTLDAFNQRKSVSVIVQPYDQTVPVVLTK